MSEINYSSFDSSILYRCNQKHFDKLLAEYEIGYTQLIFLTQIYENEGVPMNELASLGCFDKGTITKSVQKLEQAGYLRVENSEADRRSKLLYTTEKAHAVLPKLYAYRQEWTNYLRSELSDEELETYVELNNRLIKKAMEANLDEERANSVRIFGLQKLTLLDYPGNMACTLFTGGCNFRCPFCHNRSLVFLNEAEQEIDRDEIMDYLNRRKGILDGVCITGGEPMLQPGIRSFIKQIRDLGLKIKLDTNGSQFEKTRELIEEGLIDYVAMDIKNTREKYYVTSGVDHLDMESIDRMIAYLLEDHIDYEFRTTVVKNFHEPEDFALIGERIKGAKRYYLQYFEDHGNCIQEGLEAVSVEEMKKCMEQAAPYVKQIEIRGMKE